MYLVYSKFVENLKVTATKVTDFVENCMFYTVYEAM